LALLLTGANRHDSRLLEPLIEAASPTGQWVGRPRKRPDKLHADKGYDFDSCRRTLRRRKIVPRIARRGIERSDKLGRHSWVIERSLAWFSRFRRLTIRYERRLDILQGFHLLAVSLICFRFVKRWFCLALLIHVI
jgi:IS5 family transposase